MIGCGLSFRLGDEALVVKLASFNARREVKWFGLIGSFEEGCCARVCFATTVDGVLGGAGLDAINGGVVAAGFDAALVLAALGHYDTNNVATAQLSVQFLAPAIPSDALAFVACATRIGRRIGYAQAELRDERQVYATASGLLAPIAQRPAP